MNLSDLVSVLSSTEDVIYDIISGIGSTSTPAVQKGYVKMRE